MNDDSLEQDDTNGIITSLREWMFRFGKRREALQKRLKKMQSVSVLMKLLVCLIMFADIVLMVYALLSVTFRASSLGVSLVDSLPLAFYALPLLILLPSMLKAYYDTRMGIAPFLIFIIAGLVFLLIAPIQPVFYLISVLNIAAIVVVLIDGRFRPQGNIRSVGKKTVGYVILLNLIGLVFPVSVYVMGQMPIASISSDQIPTMYLGVPTAPIEYTTGNIFPSTEVLDALQDAEFGVDISYLAGDNGSLNKTRAWLTEAANRSIPIKLTVHSNRSEFLIGDRRIGTQDLIFEVYSSLTLGAQNVLDTLLSLGIAPSSISVQTDMRLSQSEWAALLEPMRTLNLGGFSVLVEDAITAINETLLADQYADLRDAFGAYSSSLSLLVDSFVVDDLQDNDSTLMLVNGVTPSILKDAASLEVDAMRTRFSLEMEGDVGEYLVHSYSRSARALGETGIGCSCRLGVIGQFEMSDGRGNPVYETIESLAQDIAICAGNGAQELTISSLESLLNAFGSSSVTELRTAVADSGEQSVTYTFRIYAFRAVVFAIDSFRIS